MNNEWIYRSKRIVKEHNLANDKDLSHEDWLDCMNLHETSWMLFVTIDYRDSYAFGWPE